MNFENEARCVNVGLLAEPRNSRSKTFKAALEKAGTRFVEFDIHAGNWWEKIPSSGVDLIVAAIPGDSVEQYSSFLNRASAIEHHLGIPVYPTSSARSLYENKQAMSDFMLCHGYPSAPTRTFTDRASALNFAKNCALPIVLKANFGSGSSGVEIVTSRRKIVALVKKHFSRIHPYFSSGYAKRIKSRRFPIALPVPGRLQRNFVLLQEYASVQWEWRIIRIGEYYFSHKKLLSGKYASGSLLKSWEVAPVHLFDLVSEICRKHDFPVMCIDIFETHGGDFIINELQCQFGHSTETLMKKDGVPGYMEKLDGRWVFREGNVNEGKSAGIIIDAYRKHFSDRTHPASLVSGAAAL